MPVDIPMDPSKPATWKTKEGVVMQIKDMEDSHISNSVAMLERSIARLRAQVNVLKAEQSARALLKQIEYAKAQKKRRMMAPTPQGRQFKDE